jgi:hypothetical protein
MLSVAAKKRSSTNHDAILANEQKQLKRSLDRTVQKKAFDQRGWGLMNYVLLDHPKLIPMETGKNNEQNTTENPTVVTDDNTRTTTTSSITETAINQDNVAENLLAKLNTCGPTTTSMIEVLLEKRP